MVIKKNTPSKVNAVNTINGYGIRKTSNFVRNSDLIEESITYTKIASMLRAKIVENGVKGFDEVLEILPKCRKSHEGLITFLSIMHESELVELLKKSKYLISTLEDILRNEKNSFMEEMANQIGKIISKASSFNVEEERENRRGEARRKNTLFRLFKSFVKKYHEYVDENLLKEIVKNYSKGDREYKNFSVYTAIIFLKNKGNEYEIDRSSPLDLFSEAYELGNTLLWYDMVDIIKKTVHLAYEEEIRYFKEKWGRSKYDNDRDFARFLEFYKEANLVEYPRYPNEFDDLLLNIGKEIEKKRIISDYVWTNIVNFVLEGIENNSFSEDALRVFLSNFEINAKDRGKDFIKVATSLYYLNRIKEGNIDYSKHLLNAITESYDITETKMRSKMESIINEFLEKLISEPFLASYVEGENIQRFIDNWEMQGNEYDREFLRRNKNLISNVINSLNIKNQE